MSLLSLTTIAFAIKLLYFGLNRRYTSYNIEYNRSNLLCWGRLLFVFGSIALMIPVLICVGYYAANSPIDFQAALFSSIFIHGMAALAVQNIYNPFKCFVLTQEESVEMT